MPRVKPFNSAVLRWLLLCAFLILAPRVLWADPVLLEQGQGRYDLGARMSYLVDDEGNLQIDQVLAAQNWQASTLATPNFAFSSPVYWFRIELQSQVDYDLPWLFEIAFPLQDYVDFYLVEEGRILDLVKTGDRRPFDSRPIAFRNFLFPVELPQGKTRQIYLRMDTNDGLHEPAPLILWQQQEFTLQYGERNLGLGLYFGIMLVMALYNLFVYLSVRDSAYLYYVAYILGFTFWLFSYYGFTIQYLWPNSPAWANQSTVVLTALWSMFVMQFVRYFLDTRRQIKWFYWVGKAYLVIMLLTILNTYNDNYSMGIFSVTFFGSIVCLCGIVAGFISWRSGYRPARYFLLAWTVLLTFLIVFCLKIIGVLPPVWFIERSVQIGSTIEVILLSLGLADRINTLKKEKMEAQDESIKAYESSLELKNDFITTISHELRTPMNAIMGGVEVAHANNNQEKDASLDIIESGAKDMMALVGDILIHTELQSGQLSVNAVDLKIRSFLDRISQPIIEASEAKGVSFQWSVAEDVPALIVVDQHKLSVILSKLLNNAVKFTDAGDIELKVLCTGDQAAQQLVCVVTDTGCGIPIERQKLIFDPFIQGEAGFTRKHGGLGIGLSICLRLTEALQGSLLLESTSGNGSQFKLSLPIEKGEAPQTTNNVEQDDKHLPVLVVEDNLVNQKVIVKMLSKLGYQSLVANQGEDALAVLDNNRVSVILMDLQMPVMDGFSCTEAIRASGKSMPIIAVTANVMEKDRKRCFECGMNEFLEKPVKLNVLKESLTRYLSTDQKNQ